MKAILLTLAILILSMGLYANPWSMVILSELWFGDNEHLYVELSTYDFLVQNYNQVQIAHGDTIVQLTQDIPNLMTPVVIDVTEQCPQLTFDPAGDTLVVNYYYFDNFYPLDGVRWGYGEYDYVHPPLPGQSLVQTHPNYLPYVSTHTYWCKDEPPTPGTSPYEPIARSILTFSVTNQDGQPVPNVSLHMAEILNYVCGYTDENGVFCDTLKAGSLFVQARHPQTNAIVHEGTIYLEPNQETEYSFEIAYTGCEDNVNSVHKSGLRAFPSPYIMNRSEFVTFRYDREVKLSKDSFLKIYDVKGRFIKQIEMDSKGTASWQPKSDTASGLYLARLISGNRIVDTATFTIMN